MNSEFWNTLLAFHNNAFSNLYYELTNNWCFAVILIAMIITIILSLQTEVETTVVEEQNVI